MAIPMVRVRLPMRIESPNAWTTWSLGQRFRRTRDERETTCRACSYHRDTFARMLAQGPVRVTLTRIGPRNLDDDNVAFACKRVRDGLALAMGVDDADPRIAWLYGQRRASAGETNTVRGFGVEIVVAAAGVS